MTQGWELMLSYDFQTRITHGYCKGTASSDVAESIQWLKGCIDEIQHPLVFPLIMFSHESSFRTDIKQRDARDWLRRIEHAVSMRVEVNEEGERVVYVKDGVVDFDALNRDLVECQAQILWKRPVVYLDIIDTMKAAGEAFIDTLSKVDKISEITEIKSIQARILSRLEFYRKRWLGTATYADTTMQRLEIQRSSVSLVPQTMNGTKRFLLSSTI
jgi:hypothetical protein